MLKIFTMWQFYFYLGMYSVMILPSFFVSYQEAVIIFVISYFLIAFFIWAIVHFCVAYYKMLFWPIMFWFDEDSKFAKWIKGY